MNERIMELQKQCITSEGHVVVNFDYDKYAELIIRECANIATMNQHQWDQVGDYVLKHFGIE